MTTTHRPTCQQPGWTTQASTSIPGLTIARCTGCGAVELRAVRPMDGSAAQGSHGRLTVEASSGRWSA